MLLLETAATARYLAEMVQEAQERALLEVSEGKVNNLVITERETQEHPHSQEVVRQTATGVERARHLGLQTTEAAEVAVLNILAQTEERVEQPITPMLMLGLVELDLVRQTLHYLPSEAAAVEQETERQKAREQAAEARELVFLFSFPKQLP